jgi:peptidoglycan-associated lipoprotein
MQSWQSLVIPVMASTVVLVGCAKKPASTQATAPPPVAPAVTGTSGVGSSGLSGATAGRAGSTDAASAATRGGGAAQTAGQAAKTAGTAAGQSATGSAQQGGGGQTGQGTSSAQGASAAREGAGAGAAVSSTDAAGAGTAGAGSEGGTGVAQDAAAGTAGTADGGAAGLGAGAGVGTTTDATGTDAAGSQIASAIGAGGGEHTDADAAEGAGGQGSDLGGQTVAGVRPELAEFSTNPALRDVYFEYDRYDVRPEDARMLDANAEWLRSNPNQLVLIQGHCDDRGTNEYNLALGEHRAKSAMNYLVSQGVQASRMTIVSYGEERPICSDQNDSCWAKNRRAHFMVKGR